MTKIDFKNVAKEHFTQHLIWFAWSNYVNIKAEGDHNFAVRFSFWYVLTQFQTSKSRNLFFGTRNLNRVEIIKNVDLLVWVIIMKMNIRKKRYEKEKKWEMILSILAFCINNENYIKEMSFGGGFGFSVNLEKKKNNLSKSCFFFKIILKTFLSFPSYLD